MKFNISLTRNKKKKLFETPKKELPDLWNMAFTAPEKTLSKSELQKELSWGINSNLFQGLTGIMPNPDPVLRKLGWNKNIEIYEELLTDPQLSGAIENNRKSGVTSLLMYIDRKNTSQKEYDFFIDYFSKLLRNGIYDNITNQTLDTPQFGRMIFGTIWDIQDGYFVPIKIIPMPHRLCKFDYRGELLISEDGIYFLKPKHQAKYIFLQHKPKLENPYGEPLLAKCYWNIRFKKDGFKLWALFTEKYGMPFVKAKYNTAAIQNTFHTDPVSAADILLDRLSLMAKDGIIVFPDGTEVDIATTGSKDNAEIYEKLVRICDEQNTKLQLGHSGATESTSGDKLSNDTTASEVRQHIIDSDKKYPIMFWNQIIYLIHQFNFSGIYLPEYNLYAKEDVDISYAKRDAIIVPVLQLAGYKQSLQYLNKTYGFEDGDIVPVETKTEEKEPEQKTVKNKNQNAKFNSKYQNSKSLLQDNQLALFNANTTKTNYPDQELIDTIANKAAGDDKPTNPLTELVVKFINKQTNYEDAIDGLSKLLNKMDTKKMQSKMEALQFAADMLGRFSVNDENKNLNTK